MWLKRQNACGIDVSHEVALHGLRRPVETRPVAQRAQQLECSACAHTSGMADPVGRPRQQLPLRDVGRVPDLLGQQAAGAGAGLQRGERCRATSWRPAASS